MRMICEDYGLECVMDENSITEMKTSGFPCIEIESMNYELRNLVINYELSLISSSIKND